MLCQIACILFAIQVEAYAQPCLFAAGYGNNSRLPEFMDYEMPRKSRIRRDYQAIIPSYSFNCTQTCGIITEWGADVRRRDNNDDFYTINFQVWRPSPTTDDSEGTGCYSLVGNNRFVSITPSRGVVVVTPSPQDYIQFQPGDVLGFYVEEALRSSDGVVYLENSVHANELVLLTSIEPTITTSWTTDGYCIYSRFGWSSLQAAPVISIATTTYPCLITQSTSILSSRTTTTDISSRIKATPSRHTIRTATHPCLITQSTSILSSRTTTTDISSRIKATPSRHTIRTATHPCLITQLTSILSSRTITTDISRGIKATPSPHTIRTGPLFYTHTSELSLQESAYTNTSTVNSQISKSEFTLTSTLAISLASGLSLTVAMFIILTILITMALCIKARKKKAISMQTQLPSDKVHRATFRAKDSACREEYLEGNEYDYTTVVCGNRSQSETHKLKADGITTESNAAYATNVMLTEQNVAYGSSTVTNENVDEADYDNIYDN